MNNLKRICRFGLALLAVLSLAFAGVGCTAKAKQAYHLSRANRYYDAGQLASAEIEYLNVLRLDPANTRAFERLGLIYYDQGRLQRSLYCLTKAVQAVPDSPDLRLKIGFIETSAGQFTQALAHANYVLDKQPINDDGPLLLAEASVFPKDARAARQRLQTLARNGDRASFEVALGNLALREHDLPAANAAFQKARALDPKLPAVNFALATAAWAQGNLTDANAFFRAAAEASPVRSPRRIEYARFKIQTGDISGAEAMLQTILKSAPDSLPAALLSAEAAAAGKKYDESASFLARVLTLDAENFDALFFQAAVALDRGQVDQALAGMDRLAHLYPQVPQVHYQLGLACLAANDLARASASFTRALELNPNFVDAALRLAQIQIKSGNADAAILSLERVRQRQTNSVEAQLLLADAYRLRHRVDDALAIYAALESAYPTNQQVILLRGSTLGRAQDTVGARREFERLLQLSPGNLVAVEQLVNLDLAVTNLAAARQRVDNEIKNHPNDIRLRLLVAKILLAQGPTAQAETALLGILKIDSANENALFLLAQLYSDTGRNKLALATVNAATANDPTNTVAWMLAADIYEQNKDWPAAAAAYERLLKIDPKNSPALNNLAYLDSERLDRLDRAYELAQRARELLPLDPATADTLGWIYYHRGAYDTALGLLKESAAKLPANPEAQFHLGMAAYLTADEATARAAFQRSFLAGTNWSGLAECQLCLAILNIDPASAAARATLEQRVAAKPNDPVALARLARLDEREGQAGKAISAYEGILRVAPKNLDSLVNLSRLYAGKDSRKAYELAKAASQLAPYNGEVSHLLGRAAFLSGDFHLAASVLQQVLRNQPNDPALLFDYARAAYSLGGIPEAAAALKLALAANLAAPDAEAARQMLDLINLAASPAQAAQADSRISGLLKADPNYVPAWIARAVAIQNTNAPAAEQAYENALAVYPDFFPAQLQLARLYASEPSKLDRAFALATKAHAARPDDSLASKTLGMILVQRADYSHALVLLKQIAPQSPADPEVFYYLGTAQFHLKSRAESKASFQQALALKLPPALETSARQMLDELK